MASHSGIKFKKKDRDSLEDDRGADSECLFEMEDIDVETYSKPIDPKQDDIKLTQDESNSETEEQSYHESEQQCKLASKSRHLAASLPVNVPVWTSSKHFTECERERDHSNKIEKCNDPAKTYQSIKELAASVQDGTELFGDLPRRRLNTGDLAKSRHI